MPDLADAVKHAMDRATRVSLTSLDHGPRHWRDVARLGFWIAGLPAKDDEIRVDRGIVFLFAVLHDSRRHDEMDDPRHGIRAAQSLSGLDLTGDEQFSLAYALEHHDRGETHDNPTIAACWDADRLTISRVGIPVERKYLSTPYVRQNVDECVQTAEKVVKGRDLTWEEIIAAYEGSGNYIG